MHPVVGLAAAGACTAFLLWLDHRHGLEHDDNRPRTFSRNMGESEYIKLLPKTEWAALNKKLLSIVYKCRGWRTECAPTDSAWRKVLSSAQTTEWGAWLEFFETTDLVESKLSLLANLIDHTFLGGLLERLVKTGKAPPLQFAIVDSNQGHDDWVSLFDPRNIIVLLRPKWNQEVSSMHPMSCEGVLCTTRLEILAHTIAHEMVHALVFHLFPEIDKASPAYLADDRHGPIFKLLNKRLFGHSNDTYRPIFKKR